MLSSVTNAAAALHRVAKPIVSSAALRACTASVARTQPSVGGR